MCKTSTEINCNSISFVAGILIGVLIKRTSDAEFLNHNQLLLIGVSAITFYVSQNLGRFFKKGSHIGYK